MSDALAATLAERDEKLRGVREMVEEMTPIMPRQAVVALLALIDAPEPPNPTGKKSLQVRQMEDGREIVRTSLFPPAQTEEK